METQGTVDLELLCAQAPWLRALARHLVRDPASAEDIAQETLLAALEAPPADVADARRLRAWLRRVAYNLSHLARRRGMRRRAREERVARNDLQVSAVETVLVNSVKRHVVDAVDALDEPYRSTVELRYFEGVSTADIAVRMGTTDNAVRKRLYRARRKLRQRLDTVHQGDRRAWFNALLPLTRLPAPSPTATAPVAVQATQLSSLTLGAAGLAAAGALFFVTLQATRPRALDPPAPVGRTALADLPATLQPGSRLEVTGSSSARRVTPATPGTRATEPPPPATEPDGKAPAADSAPGALAPLQLAGRVVDLSGTPLGGLAIHAGDGGEALAWSDSSGRFELALAAEAEVRLRATGNAFATLQEALVGPQSAGRELLIVATRAVNVSGQVVDQYGLPLAGADVRLEADERAFLALEHDLAGTLLARAATHTDEHGFFSLSSLPSGVGIELRAEVTGSSAELFEGPLHQPVPARDAHDLRLVLARAATPPLVLEGIVRFEGGEPAPQTLVHLGRRTTWTDAYGAFTFRLRHLSPGLELIAERPGYRQIRFPKLSALVRRDEALTLQRDLSVNLVLVESRNELAGSVLDASGRPCVGWVVRARACEEGTTAHAAGHASGSTEALTATALTDETGRFLLAGLLDRAHDIVAYDASTLLSVRSTQIAPGETDVILELSAQDTLLASVSGRVTDEAGVPIAGADVRVALALGTDEVAHGGQLHAFRRATKTDALGTFQLFDVPRHSVEIAVRAAGAELHHALDPGRAQELVITVPRPIGVRISTVLAEASTFAIVDDAGNPLPLHGASRESRARGRLHAGQSILYSTSSTQADGVILFDGNDDEIGRLALDAFKRPLRY